MIFRNTQLALIISQRASIPVQTPSMKPTHRQCASCAQSRIARDCVRAKSIPQMHLHEEESVQTHVCRTWYKTYRATCDLVIFLPQVPTIRKRASPTRTINTKNHQQASTMTKQTKEQQPATSKSPPKEQKGASSKNQEIKGKNDKNGAAQQTKKVEPKKGGK